MNIKANLACGSTFVVGEDWINLDFSPHSRHVGRANLLAELPLPSNYLDGVYSSHFLEHVPRSDVPTFLAESFRVLKSGGVLRLVLPDLENICREYLRFRDRAEHEKADFLVIELLDQCVRRVSGGELGAFYRQLHQALSNDEISRFVSIRMGDWRDSNAAIATNVEDIGLFYKFLTLGTRLFSRVQQMAISLWLKIALAPIPSAFKKQNISFAAVGELHQWMWDYHQLKTSLEAAGFIGIERKDCSTSWIKNFPFFPLDIDSEGLPRKGEGSMFIEALKP